MPAQGPDRSGLPAVDRAWFSPAPQLRRLLPLGPRFGALVTTMAARSDVPLEVRARAAAEHVVALRLRGAATSRVQVGPRESIVVLRPDDLTLIPAGIESTWCAPAVGQSILHLHLVPAWLDTVAEEAGLPSGRAAPALRLGFAHAGLLRAMSALLRLDEPDEAADPLAVALAGLACCTELLRLGADDAERLERRYRLAPAILRRVQAHVEEILPGQVTLEGMAAAARLSPFHFSRAFRRETGTSPLAYVRARRCERAKRLMLEGRLSLAEVALACGFAHQAHFTTIFGRIVGTTPGRWRAERMG